MSKIMQCSTINIKVRLDYLNSLLQYVSQFRSDEDFNSVLVEVSENKI